MFVHLHGHSHYSLLDGLAKVDEYVAHAKKLGMRAIALTDHGNLYGAIEFYRAAKKADIKPILGVEAYVAPRSRFDKTSADSEKYYHLTLLAKNNTGWKNLLQLVTKGNLEGFYYKPRIDKELLAQHSEGLIALSGCPSGELARHILRGRTDKVVPALKEYQDIFGDDFYIEIWHQPGIPEVNNAVPHLVALARTHNVPLVATQDMHYLKKDDSFYHEVLLAVQTGHNLADDDRMSLKDAQLYMRSPEEMKEAFVDYPDAIENTLTIADACNVELTLGETLLPKFATPQGHTSDSYLRHLINERIGERFDTITPTIKDRLEYELGVIERMGFADYFLIVQDFVNWAKARKIVVGPGRGSAAGSLVSYILHITDIDPIKYDLLFERFLNPERIQMPDIDIDFTDVRRDEVFGYLQQTYGTNNVAHIITFGTMASRAAIRDAGRALGLSYGFCDRLAKMIPFNFSLQKTLDNVKEFKQEYEESDDARKVIDAAQHLEGVARHASVHACGTVIAEQPLTEYMPLQFAPQDPDTIVTQFEMGAVEQLGLLKMDLLGLKNLTILEHALRTIKDMHGKEIQLSRLDMADAATFETLQRGDTTGVFQLESSGMRRYLKELQPSELEDIIAIVALYRPGPMELIPSYVARKHGKEEVTYLHPKLAPILENTYGIGIYQEQMMRIARDLAGYSLAEADILRKAIGKKIQSLLDEQKGKLINGMIDNDIPKDIAQKIWELFPPFARYGFNRSHAVCYAYIAYQTAYLKTHYPLAFMTALFNADMNDIDRISFLVSETRKMNIPVRPPDINASYAQFEPEDEGIRFGMAAIKNVGTNVVQAIVQERQKGGPFKDIKDVLARVTSKDLNKKSLESLIKAGAFDSMGYERNQLLSNIDTLIVFAQQLRKETNGSQHNLFGSHTQHAHLSLSDADPASKNQTLSWEKELLGFYFSDHPLNGYKDILVKKKVSVIKDILQKKAVSGIAGSYRIAGVITTIRHIVTKKNEPMAFATIEDLSDTMEVIVFPRVLEKKTSLWTENTIVILQGKMSDRDSDMKLIVDEAIELT